MSLGVHVTGNVSKMFSELAKRWPSLQYGLMSMIGYEGRRALYENYLRGQVINLRKYPYDKRGSKYRTVSYSIARNRKSVKIASYPLNLYNPLSVYSSAAGTVRARIESKMPEYDRRVLQRRIDQIDRKFK